MSEKISLDSSDLLRLIIILVYLFFKDYHYKDSYVFLLFGFRLTSLPNLDLEGVMTLLLISNI